MMCTKKIFTQKYIVCCLCLHTFSTALAENSVPIARITQSTTVSRSNNLSESSFSNTAHLESRIVQQKSKPAKTIRAIAVNSKPTVSDDNQTTPEDVVLNAVLLATDVDGDILTFTKATNPAHGTVIVRNDGSYTYTPAQDYSGPDLFSILVSDGNGGTKTARIYLTIIAQNDAPQVSNDNLTTSEDSPVNATINATDIESDMLSYSESTPPSHGTLVVNNDATYIYTPSQDYFGTDFFHIAVNDGNGGISIARIDVTVTPVNDNPYVADVSLTLNENAVLNDKVVGSDVDGDVLTYTKGFDPFHGTLTVLSNGSYTYTPDLGFTGNDLFSINISDGKGGSYTSTINVTVGLFNDLPIVSNQSIYLLEDQLFSGTISATDPEGEALTFSKGSDPSHGTVVVYADGTYTYTPNLDYSGPDAFTILVTDTKGGSSTSNITVTIDPDTDNDGKINPLDPDDDNDGVPDIADAFPLDPNETRDTDLDGIGNNADTDDDGDGFTDITETTAGTDPLDPNSKPVIQNNPVATDDTKTTNEDTPVSGSITATDPDADLLTFSKATSPTHGNVIVNTDGTYTYSPVANYFGSDSFTVNVSDGKGGTDIATISITIDPVNDAPIANDETKTTNEDTPVNGIVTATDVDGDLTTFTKATNPAHGIVTVNATGSYTYTPTTNYFGMDSFTVNLSDGKGGTDMATISITINSVNDAPTATDDTKTTNEDTPVSGSIAATDPDADLLTFSKATSPTHGNAIVNTDGTYTYSPVANYFGSDSFTVNVSDGKGGTDIATISITIDSVNDAPTANDETKSTNKNTAVNGAATATDIESDILTFSKASDPTHGSVIVNPLGTYTYIPNTNYTGIDSFTINVSDGKGGTDIATITITVNVTNDAPIATDDTKTTNEDTTVSGSVSATDPDADLLTFSKATSPTHGNVIVNTDGTYTYSPAADYFGSDSFTVNISDGKGGTDIATISITIDAVNDAPTANDETKTTNEDTPVNGIVTATDVDGDLTTFTKATNPAHGIVTVNATGSYTYTPTTNYFGTDSFTVNVSDGKGGTDMATISITINPVNDAPTAIDDTKTTNEDTPVSGSITVTDPDADLLTFSKATSPTHGNAIVNTDGTYTYTPAADYFGADSFTANVSDGKGGTDIATISITIDPVNDAPTANDDTKTTNKNIATNGNATATDIESDILTFSKAGDPTHGSVIVDQFGAYNYTPNTNYTGIDSFTINVSDGKGGTDIATITIIVNVTNDAPTATDDTKTTNEDTPVSGSVSATDPDADLLTFSKATSPTHGNVIVNTDGTYTYTPVANYFGSDSFTVNVSDGKGGTDIATISITIIPVNDAPTANDETKTTNEDTPVNGIVTATDVDGDLTTFTKATNPAHGSVAVSATGSYTYTPTTNYFGKDSFTINVNDNKGGSDIATISIIINPTNDAPIATDDTRTTNEDTDVDGVVTATDIDGDIVIFSVQNQPQHGIATVNSNGTYSYSPFSNYYGNDNFTIVANDGKGGTSVAKVSIVVIAVNDVPQAPNQTETTQKNTAISNSISAEDKDGDLLQFTIQTNPSHGTVTIDSKGIYIYIPSTDYSGTDSFNVLIVDGKGGSTVTTITLLIVAYGYADLSIIPLFNEVLAVSNPSDFGFIYDSTFQWYKDGELLDSKIQYYGFGGTIPSGNYIVKIFSPDQPVITLAYTHHAITNNNGQTSSILYPNPYKISQQCVNLQTTVDENKNLQTVVYDQSGKQIDGIDIQQTKNRFTYSGFKNKGMYIIKLMEEGKVLESHKLIVKE